MKPGGGIEIEERAGGLAICPPGSSRDARLDSFETEFGSATQALLPSLTLTRLSPISPAAFEIDSKGNIFQTRDLTHAEHAFVANERAMCMASCLYFLTRYYWIKTRNRIQRFAFRQGQWILWLMMCELDRLGVSKMMQILKARQLGISTLAEGIATWASLFIPGVASQIGSADGGTQDHARHDAAGD